jgi:hypothetical protein
MFELAYRRLIAAAGLATPIAAVLLAGCAARQQSLKDDVSPQVAGYVAYRPPVTPAATKAAVRVPPRPRPEPVAHPPADTHPRGCTPMASCLARIKAMVDDPARTWIGRPQSAEEHADGTRQFAYRALRTRLSCSELAQAVNELAAAIRRFQAPPANITPEQAAQVRKLDAEVEGELSAERASRCSR